MVDEFSLPQEIIDRKVTKMKMISPSNREVDVGKTLSETEYIGMCRREVLDSYLRKRATDLGTKVVNGLVMRLEQVSCGLWISPEVAPHIPLQYVPLYNGLSKTIRDALHSVFNLHCHGCHCPFMLQACQCS